VACVFAKTEATISVRQTRYEALQKETKIYKERVAREVLAVR